MALSVEKPRCWQQLHVQLSRHLASVGLDICHAFTVQRYNEHGPASPLPTFNRRCTLAILVGNSQALWPHFVEHLRHTPGALECNDPLDAYTSSKIVACVKDLLDGMGTEVRHSHILDKDLFVDMLRASHVSGLAYLDKASHLCMHPTHGPWFALRSLIIIDADGPDAADIQPLGCPFTQDQQQQIEQSVAELKAKGGFDQWKKHWVEWIAIRQLAAEFVGAGVSKYCQHQLEYHYIKDVPALAESLGITASLHQDV